MSLVSISPITFSAQILLYSEFERKLMETELNKYWNKRINQIFPLQISVVFLTSLLLGIDVACGDVEHSSCSLANHIKVSAAF